MRTFTSRTALFAAVALLAGCGGGGGGSHSSNGPKIATQPSAVTAAAGGTATFTVAANGDGLTYQWYRNGTVIDGATAASYTTGTLNSSDGGTKFYVVVTSSNGSTKSATVTLTVGAAGTPSITSQPGNVSAPLGGTASFVVVATGDGLTYQWFKGSTAIAGATSATYTVSPVTADSAGTYFVRVTNANGSADSATATLSIGSATAPQISTQPRSQSVAVGGRATFAVAASGSGSLAYQWYKDGVAIAGATGSTYTIGAATNAAEGSYTVSVTNSVGSVTSSAATLNVVAPPAITGQPTGGTVFTGGSLTLTVAATGEDLTYQWSRNGVSIPGATSASYTIASATATDAGSYRVTVSNVAGTVASNAVAVTVNGAPTITTQPSSTTVGVGSAATFTVTASGSGSLMYQWYKNGTAISGATGTSYTTPATTTSDNGAKFTVVVTNGGGSTTSSAATLTVDQAPVITSQPSPVTVTHPATATFSVTATASGTLTYQWYSSTKGLIAGATSSTYATPATATADSGQQFYVKVYNDGVISTTSGSATLTVN